MRASFEKIEGSKMICEEEENGDDDILAEALDRVELQLGRGGGGAREAIDFELIPYTDCRACRFRVHRRVYTTRVSQPLNATVNRGNIAQRLENGLRHAVLQRVLNGEEDDHDFFFVNMSSNRLHHAYQSHRVSVGEWRKNEEPVQRMFGMMSRILNSNQQFEIDDSFHVEVTRVRNPG